MDVSTKTRNAEAGADGEEKICLVLMEIISGQFDIQV